MLSLLCIDSVFALVGFWYPACPRNLDLQQQKPLINCKQMMRNRKSATPKPKPKPVQIHELDIGSGAMFRFIWMLLTTGFSSWRMIAKVYSSYTDYWFKTICTGWRSYHIIHPLLQFSRFIAMNNGYEEAYSVFSFSKIIGQFTLDADMM